MENIPLDNNQLSTKQTQKVEKDKQKNNYLLYGWLFTLIIGLTYLVLTPQDNKADAPKVEAKLAGQSSESKEVDSLIVSRLSYIEATPTPIQTELTTESPTIAPTITPVPAMITHIVESGDMLLSIAAEYDLDVEDVLEANNGLDPTLLQIGQELIIPVTVTPTPLPPTPMPTPKESPTPTPTPLVYIVQPGDSPMSIALKHDTTSEAIMWVNKIFNPSGLQVGQELIIPSDDDLSEIASSSQTVLHVVGRGDTLLVLASKYGSTVDDILEANPEIDPTNLVIGDQVIVPLTQPRTGQTSYALNNYSPQPAVVIPDPPAPGLVGLQQQMILAINAHRAANGLAPYVADGTLNQVAFARAQDMDSRGYFSHITPEGKRIRDLVREQGVSATWVGENIERNVQPADQTVAHSINWFMNDPPHRYNILHPNYNRVGVGVSGQPNFHTFVLVFAD
jgi:uncharacterized protein YkwD